MQWHEVYPKRWWQEQVLAARLIDNFKANINTNGMATILGTFHIYSQHGHMYESVRLRIIYPQNFLTKNQPPSVYLESHHDRWQKDGNSHIENDWKLCLFVPGESGIDFSTNTSLNDLFAVIHTFLFKERVYQKRLAKVQINGSIARWPGEDRSHGNRGIREAIQDSGEDLGRNDPCPCGSGLKYKKCHMQEIQRWDI